MAEDWQKWVADDLEVYPYRKYAVENLPQEIQSLQQEIEAIRKAHSKAKQAGETFGSLEDRMLSCLIRQRELVRNLEYVKGWLKAMDAGFARLTGEERRILEGFYITPEKGIAQQLGQELAVSKATLYRRRDAALKHFAMGVYGVGDLWELPERCPLGKDRKSDAPKVPRRRTRKDGS